MTDLVQRNNCAGCMRKRSLLFEHFRTTGIITILYSNFYNLDRSRKIKDSEPKESRRALDLSACNFFMLAIIICMCFFSKFFLLCLILEGIFSKFMLWFYPAFCSPGINVYLGYRVSVSRHTSLLSATEYSALLRITYNFHPRNIQHHQTPVTDTAHRASAEHTFVREFFPPWFFKNLWSLNLYNMNGGDDWYYDNIKNVNIDNVIILSGNIFLNTNDYSIIDKHQHMHLTFNTILV